MTDFRIGRAIHYFDIAAFYAEVDRVLVRNGVLCYYSVDFPAVSSPNNIKFGERIHDLFWKQLKSPRLSGYWPVNPSNKQIVDWDRRNFYLNVLTAPYLSTRTDETVAGQRETSVEQLAAELSTYSAIVTLRYHNLSKLRQNICSAILTRAFYQNNRFLSPS